MKMFFFAVAALLALPGVASAAQSLNDAQMDQVVAGQISLPNCLPNGGGCTTSITIACASGSLCSSSAPATLTCTGNVCTSTGSPPSTVTGSGPPPVTPPGGGTSFVGLSASQVFNLIASTLSACGQFSAGQPAC